VEEGKINMQNVRKIPLQDKQLETELWMTVQC
jgi:hypothetical protein